MEAARHPVRGAFEALAALALLGGGAWLAVLGPISWIYLGLVLVVLAHGLHFASVAHHSLGLGSGWPRVGWLLKGLGHLGAAFSLAAAALTDEVPALVLLAAVVFAATGLGYLKIWRDQRGQDGAPPPPAPPEERARSVWGIWTAIALSHAVIAGVALTGVLELHPDGGSTPLVAFLAAWGVVTAAIAHRHWRKAIAASVEPESFTSYLIAWVLAQSVSIYGLVLTMFGTPIGIWIWFPLVGLALSLAYRPRPALAAA